MDNYSADDATNWTTSNWSQLRSINYYLDNMRNAVASDAILDHYEGVGRFFRALFYIDKVNSSHPKSSKISTTPAPTA